MSEAAGDEQAEPWPATPARKISPIFIADLLLSADQWVNRRVHRLEFMSETTVKVSTSIDYNLLSVRESSLYLEAFQLSGLPFVLVPIGPFSKAPFTNFSVTGNKGNSLSLLTQKRTESLVFEALLKIAELTAPRVHILDNPSVVAECIKGDLQQIMFEKLPDGASMPVERLRRVLERQKGSLSGDYMKALCTDASFYNLIRTLEDHFLAIVRVPRDDLFGVIKYSFNATLDSQRRARSKLGWAPSKYSLSLPLARYAASYHLEVHAPPGIHLSHFETVATAQSQNSPNGQFVGIDTVTRWITDSSLDSPDVAHAVIHQDSEVQDSEVGPGTSFSVRFGLAPTRAGTVRLAVVGAALSTAILLLTALLANDGPAGTENLKGELTLILLGPSLIATYVIRVSEHVLTAKLLYYFRAVLLVGVAIPCYTLAFVVAVQLQSAIRWTAWSTFIVSAVAFVCTGVTYWSTDTKRYRRGPQPAGPAG